MLANAPATDYRWLPNYMKSFGLVAGLSLMRRVIRFDRARRPDMEAIFVPGLGEIWMRATLRDHAIFQQVWVKREYDLAAAAPHHFQALMAYYEASVARGARPMVLDAGAHVGMSVLWWSQLFPKAHIVAVEASSANIAVLRRNVQGLENVTVLHAALAGKPGTLCIGGSEIGGAAVRLADDGLGERVPAITVDQILKEFNSEEILLAKIDIEGGEFCLFSGNLDWLDNTQALAVETHDWLFPRQGTSRSLFSAIASRSFDFLARGENVLLFHY